MSINGLNDPSINFDVTLNNWIYGSYEFGSSNYGYNFYKDSSLLEDPTIFYNNYCSKVSILNENANSILNYCP